MKPGRPMEMLGGSMKVPPNAVRKDASSSNPSIVAPLSFVALRAAYSSN